MLLIKRKFWLLLKSFIWKKLLLICFGWTSPNKIKTNFCILLHIFWISGGVDSAKSSKSPNLMWNTKTILFIIIVLNIVKSTWETVLGSISDYVIFHMMIITVASIKSYLLGSECQCPRTNGKLSMQIKLCKSPSSVGVLIAQFGLFGINVRPKC